MSVRPLFLLLGFLAWSVVASRAVDREFKRTFPVQPGCTLKVDTYRGGITVEESDVAEVRVVLQMDIGADTEEEAEHMYAALQLEAASDGKVVFLRARNPRQTRVRFVWHDKNQIDLVWKITVPRQCNVELATLSGGITVGSLTGNVIARAETGVIFLKRIEGSIEASTQVGDVVVSRCSGPVTARVLRGAIRLGTIGGPIDLKNTTGEVEVLTARAGIRVAAQAGDVTVGFPREVGGEASITTAGGNIFVRIDPAANCEVSASSVWGHVETLLPIAIESGASGKGKLMGRVGRGGPKLVFHANGGHVKITPGETPFD